jgi:iron complex transport system ATP-binding protein
MADPDVILLDEPTSGLDLAGRESLIASLQRLAGDTASPSTVLVTHHVEDIPASTTHLLAIADGAALVAGPLEETLDADLLGRLFGLDVTLTASGGRWSARASAPHGSRGSWTQATDGSPTARRSASASDTTLSSG